VGCAKGHPLDPANDPLGGSLRGQVCDSASPRGRVAASETGVGCAKGAPVRLHVAWRQRADVTACSSWSCSRRPRSPGCRSTCSPRTTRSSKTHRRHPRRDRSPSRRTRGRARCPRRPPPKRERSCPKRTLRAGARELSRGQVSSITRCSRPLPFVTWLMRAWLLRSAQSTWPMTVSASTVLRSK